jgi:hypothetical protein
MHKVEIDQVSQKYDGQNNLVKESREELVGARFGGSDKFVAAYKAMRELDPDDKLDISTLEVSVDGSMFRG